MITLLLVVILLTALPASSLPLAAETTEPSPGVLWSHQFGGISSTAVSTSANAVAVNGDIYMAGSTEGALPGQISAGNVDVYIRKYDANGNELWTRQFGSSSHDSVWSLAVDISGIYAVGETHGVLPDQTQVGASDIYIRRYDVNGNEIWTRQFGSLGWDMVRSVAVDSSGVYIAGATSGPLPDQASSGGFIRKYDINGNEVWTRQFGSIAILSVAVDGSGIYIAGSDTFPGETTLGGSDAFVRKYDLNGNAEWTRQFGSTSDDTVWGVAADSSGIYLVGETRGALPQQTHAGDVDVFVRKYSVDGNEVWTRQFGSASFDYARSVAVGNSGVYMTGYMSSDSVRNEGGNYTRKYDLNGNEVWTQYLGYSHFSDRDGIAVDSSGIYRVGNPGISLPGQTSSGGYIRKYNADGGELWTRQFNAIKMSLAPDGASAIAASGDLYVAGATSGAIPSQIHLGKADAFLRKYDVTGNEVWTRQFGSSAEDYVGGVAVDSSGIYVVGVTYGSLPDQTNAGQSDAYIRKYDFDGNEIWTHQFGSTDSDSAADVAVDSSGVYVIGHSYGTLQPSAGGAGAYVRKYSIDGNEIWTSQFGTSANDFASGVAVDSSAIYITSSSGDAHIHKYDKNGVELWTRRFGSVVGEVGDNAWDVAVDSSGVYVIGDTYGALPDQSHVGESDAYIRKYDLDGNEAWTHQFGTDRLDSAGSVAVDSSGIYVVGNTFGILPGQAGVRYYDAFVRKYDATGNEVWTYQFGSMSDDFAFGVVVDSSGLYIVGEMARPIPGDTEADPADAFILKLTKDAFEWEKVYLPAIHTN
ncbi:MAG: SBBP repeat-containing protein [Caldilineaceae bacterium]|nr:SBBP repeat-containing protein [Caldilineaceae bacterium]